VAGAFLKFSYGKHRMSKNGLSQLAFSLPGSGLTN
jgi:hypothetical protein